jgi:hypothetical protein
LLLLLRDQLIDTPHGEQNTTPSGVHPIRSVPLNIDIISDVVCPWCYIGKRQIETALAQYAQQNRTRSDRGSHGGRSSSIRRLPPKA